MTTTDVERPTAETAEIEIEIDPRIQERRTEVTRARHRRQVRTAVIVAAFIVAAGLAVLTLYSPFLDVDHIRVNGARRLEERDIRAATGVQNGDALWFVDTAEVTRRLEALPWVRDVSVTRDFPDTLRINVREHTPVAFVRASTDAVMLIAGDGRAIARVATPPPGATEIVGVRRAPELGELLSPPEAANVVTHVPRELATRVVAIDVALEGLALRLADDDVTLGGTIRLGGPDDLRAKFAAAIAVLQANGGEPFDYIDVSTPALPTVMDA
jgi:cell division protein FtsQ